VGKYRYAANHGSIFWWTSPKTGTAGEWVKRYALRLANSRHNLARLDYIFSAVERFSLSGFKSKISAFFQNYK
jgi:alpha-amylase/alpha-mannosidase (GH57 family)